MKQIAILVMVSVLGFVFYLSLERNSELFRNDANNPVILEDRVTVNVDDCYLTKEPCVLKLSEELTLSVSANVNLLKPLEPVVLKVSTKGINISELQSLRLSFVGKHMDMGNHLLLPDETKSNDSIAVFKGMIPVCSIDPTMQWLARLEFTNDGRSFQINTNIISTSQ